MNRTVGTLFITLVFLFSYYNTEASEPLEIILSEDENDDRADSSSPYFIDNQSYLEEYRKRRSGTAAVPVTIITIDNSSCPRSKRGFRGIEYYDGSTVFRYYDGYPVNCRRYFHAVRPRRNPPQAVESKRPRSRGNGR